jgi:hypothetical protein
MIGTIAASSSASRRPAPRAAMPVPAGRPYRQFEPPGAEARNRRLRPHAVRTGARRLTPNPLARTPEAGSTRCLSGAGRPSNPADGGCVDCTAPRSWHGKPSLPATCLPRSGWSATSPRSPASRSAFKPRPRATPSRRAVDIPAARRQRRREPSAAVPAPAGRPYRQFEPPGAEARNRHLRPHALRTGARRLTPNPLARTPE